MLAWALTVEVGGGRKGNTAGGEADAADAADAAGAADAACTPAARVSANTCAHQQSAVSMRTRESRTFAPGHSHVHASTHAYAHTHIKRSPPLLLLLLLEEESR